MNCQFWLIASRWVSVRSFEYKFVARTTSIWIFRFGKQRRREMNHRKVSRCRDCRSSMFNINLIMPSVSIRCLSCCSSDLLIPANENDGRFRCFTTELLTCARNNSIKYKLMIIGRKIGLSGEPENDLLMRTERNRRWYRLIWTCMGHLKGLRWLNRCRGSQCHFHDNVQVTQTKENLKFHWISNDG